MPAVLVVRQPDEFSRLLAERGLEIINCPTIETVPVEDLSDLDSKIAEIANYDGIFITSSAAAEIFLRKWRESRGGRCARIYVLGRRSHELLRHEGFDISFNENANTAREMIGAIPAEDLEGRRFLFIRGERSMGTIPELLGKTASVDETTVYQTRDIIVGPGLREEIRIRADRGDLICACFFSPSGVESFLNQFGSGVLRQTKVAAIGKTTANYLSQQHVCADYTAKKATTEGFAAELLKFIAGD